MTVTSTSVRWRRGVEMADLRPAGERGRLVIADAALEHTAGIAALRAHGVVRRGGSMEKLTGRSKPGVELRRSGDRLRVLVSVGLSWPEPVADTARAVRDDVAATMARVSGMTVEAVDVTVTHLEPTDRRLA